MCRFTASLATESDAVLEVTSFFIFSLLNSSPVLLPGLLIEAQTTVLN